MTCETCGGTFRGALRAARLAAEDKVRQRILTAHKRETGVRMDRKEASLLAGMVTPSPVGDPLVLAEKIDRLYTLITEVDEFFEHFSGAICEACDEQGEPGACGGCLKNVLLERSQAIRLMEAAK